MTIENEVAQKKSATAEKKKSPEKKVEHDEVKAEMQRSWSAYKEYAWGYDVLLPLSKKGFNWYEESLGISPIDAYSTLALMGLEAERPLLSTI